MVFSDSSGKAGLVEDVDFLCSSNGTSYPVADKTRNINRHYYKAVISILRSSGRFQYDDSNKTDLPVLTFDLVAGQKDYSLPTGALKISALEVKDIGGNWNRLQELDVADLTRTITDFENTNGMPRWYDTSGESFFLYPSPAAASVTTTAGGKIYIQREIDTFASTDTTKEPGFAEPFHRILSLGAAYDWLVVNGSTDKQDRLLAQYTQLLTELRDFYSDRNRDTQRRIRPVYNTLQSI